MTTVAVGPDWTSVMTAIGTVAVALVAVGVALFAEWRADKRVADERAHSAQQLREEREHSAAQIAEERRIAREREQLTEAYAVQVVQGEAAEPAGLAARGGQDDQGSDYEELFTPVKRLAAVVVNRGRYTITRVEAQFSLDGTNLVTPHRYERLSAFPDLPERLREEWGPPARETALYGVLAPWDAGLRFETDREHVKFATSPYPVVRWKDQWGIWWEHKRGEVRQIRDGQEWAP